jgi:NTP pyrophosphatase (non-canonical NTP hydrolase)
MEGDVARPRSGTGELSKQCVEDSERWFGDMAVVHSVPHHALALAGEVGEFCNIVKKIERGSLNLQDAGVRYDLQMELTDIYVYLLNLAGLLGVDLEHAYVLKRIENENRFVKARAERHAERMRKAAANGPADTQS